MVKEATGAVRLTWRQVAAGAMSCARGQPRDRARARHTSADALAAAPVLPTYYALIDHRNKQYHAVLPEDYRVAVQCLGTPPRSLCGLHDLEPLDHTREGFTSCKKCDSLLPKDAICTSTPRP